jgi:hypothetical protein
MSDFVVRFVNLKHWAADFLTNFMGALLLSEKTMVPLDQ